MVSFILLYLDNSRLSSMTMIKYIQAFTFISILFVMLLYINNAVLIDIVSYIKDNDNNINLHGHRYVIVIVIVIVILDKQEAKFIGKDLNRLGGQIIGLGATIVDVSIDIGKAITKSLYPISSLINKFIDDSNVSFYKNYSLIFMV